MTRFPSANDVAHAVVAGAREFDVDPEMVVGSKPSGSYPVAASRARSYAAMALDRVFNAAAPATKHAAYAVSRTALARMVGAPDASQDGLVQSLESRLKNRISMSWWSNEAFERVVAAVARSAGLAAVPQVKVAPGADGPTCEQYGGPRSKYSVSVCRGCYTANRHIQAAGVPAEPKPAPAAKPAAALKASQSNANAVGSTPVTYVREGVTVVIGMKGALVSAALGDVEIQDRDAGAVVAVLHKGMPGVIPTNRIAEKVWGRVQDSDFRVAAAADRANRLISGVGLKIKHVPKLGYALVPTGE